MDKNSERIDALDSLKGIGACIVAFIWHYQHYKPQWNPFGNLFRELYNYGWIMVEMFFMISGFVIARGYKNKILNEEISFKNFLGRRIRYLYPLMLTTLIVVTIEQGIFLALTRETFQYQNFDLYHFFLNVFCIQYGWIDNHYSFNAPSWCISVSLFLYILFYGLIVLAKKERVKPTLLFSLLASVGFVLYKTGLDLPFINSQMARGIICFSLGVLIYELYIGVSEKQEKLFQGITYIVNCIFVVLLILTWVLGDRIWGGAEHFYYGFVIVLSPLCIWSAIQRGVIRRLLEWKPLVRLGKCSLAIYLWHFPVQLAVKIVDTLTNIQIEYSSKKFFIINVGITLLVAYSYTYFKKKSTR